MKKRKKAKADSLTIDTVATCECCSFEGIKWQDFLEGFTENLPQPGQRVLLRVHDPDGLGFLLRCCGNEH